MKALCLALFLTILASPQVQMSQATKKHAAARIISDGNQLFSLCQPYKTDRDKGTFGAGCAGYIMGVAQTLVLGGDTEAYKSPCPSEGVTNEQIADVVVKWMDDHPEKRHLPAPYIVAESLIKAFPCD